MKIKCVGFSVTEYGDPCYPVLLDKILKQRFGNDYSVEYSSLGGLSIDSLPYILNEKVLDTSYDLLIFEIATSNISLYRNNYYEAIKNIKAIISIAKQYSKKILFLNLYRRDIDDLDLVVKAILKNIGECYILDLKNNFRKSLLENGVDGTVDGVHPNADTIQFIASQLSDCIMSFDTTVDDKASPISTQRYSNFFISMPNFVAEDYVFDNRHGVLLETKVLRLRNTYSYKYESPVGVNGIYFVWGPDTSSVNLLLDDQLIKVNMYDEMSFYRRIGYHYFGQRVVSNIEIILNSDRNGISLKREPWEKIGDMACYFGGFSGDYFV
jgi:hypothetical protein